MLGIFHDFHLVFHLLVQHSILHEAAFLQLLCCVWFAIELGSHLMHSGKGAFSDMTYPVVFL